VTEDTRNFSLRKPNTTDKVLGSRPITVRESFAMARAFSLETQLLLCCARTRLDDQAKESVRQLIRQGPDWPHLLRAAEAHGIGPLLYKSLRAIGQDAIPLPALVWLRSHTQQIFIWSNLLAQELVRVLAIFEAHDLPAIPYKGPVLTVSAYGDLSLRPFGDLDIWVHQQDMKRGKEILLSLGYQPGHPDEMRDEDVYIRTYHDYLLVKKTREKEIHLELQWGVTEFSFSFPIEFRPLWERRQSVSLLGRTVPNLSVEDTLLILCVHGAKHGWNKLMWVCDIAELLRTNAHLHWPRLMRHAEELGGRRMVLLGLHLANRLLGAELSEEVRRHLRADSVVDSLALQVQEELFRGYYDPDNLLSERPFFYMNLRERWQDKARVFLRYCPEYFSRMVTPTEKDHAFLPLPTSFSFLYYLLRPLRLVGTYARQTLRFPQQR
jgi:hypothetical protein